MSPAAMTSGKALAKCDCLDRCGDDPAIAKGHAARCERSRAMDRELAELGERIKLEPLLATEAAIERVRFGAVSHQADGAEWLATAGDVAGLSQGKTAGSPPAVRLAQAARYLVLTQRAEQHPTQLHLVRLIPTPRSPKA